VFANLLASGSKICCRARHYSGYTPSYGYGPGFALGHGVLGWLVLIVILYAAFHVLTAHLFHSAHRRRGRRVNYGWSLWRGPWVSWRVLGGTYYHHA
jgi:hypothetical protein